MKVAVTGETGFLGYHITQNLIHKLRYDTISLGRNYQTEIERLRGCDWLIHCAGVNRGQNVAQSNISITKELVTLLEDHKITINIAFSSSTQEKLDNEYGNSKRECSKILSEYCKRAGTIFIGYQVPNLFGPFGKPNYNSVVATFCHNAVQGIESKTNNAEVNLCYVSDAASVICSFNKSEFNTTRVSIEFIHKKILDYHKQYSTGIIPKLDNKFELDLFNTYRSFAERKHALVKREDQRGHLIELVKSLGSESQVFFSVTKPGITRGNHFHFRKIERFCVLKGEARISIRKVGENNVDQYLVSGDTHCVIDMPVLCTHNITNIGSDDLICVFWSNEIYNQEDPDTYFLEV